MLGKALLSLLKLIGHRVRELVLLGKLAELAAFAQQQGGKWQGRRLLAESTQTGNAWVFAGAAAAVAGVALLALSARKQAVVVEV